MLQFSLTARCLGFTTWPKSSVRYAIQQPRMLSTDRACPDPITNEIYIGFGHRNHGWLFAYGKASLQQKAIFNDTPDGAGGGLWNSGGARVIDDRIGKVYIMTGVDQDDPPSGYNDSFLRLAGNDLSIADFFQPDDASCLALNDADLKGGSPVLMPDDSSNTPHELIGGGKDGELFVVNRDSMGSFSATTDNVIQTVQTGVQQFDNLFDAPADSNGTLYVHCEAEALQAFSWNNGQPSNQPVGSMRNILSAPRVPESRFRRTAPTTGLSGRSTIAMTIAAGLRFCAPTTPRMFPLSYMTARRLDRGMLRDWL